GGARGRGRAGRAARRARAAVRDPPRRGRRGRRAGRERARARGRGGGARVSGLVLVHGGAGPMRHMEGDRERAYREGLERAARAGREALLARGDALAAVVAAVKYMEADGPFNAGIGACLDVEGRYALDAALMRGRDRAAGAVGACSATLHPTEVCLDLLREGRHVLLVGEGADRRAQALGLPALPPIPARKLETYRKLLGETEA